MESSSVTLITLMSVLFSRISGAEVELRVRPGDDITLYCDCVWESGFNIVWFRNSSCEHQPPLSISTEDFLLGTLPRYTLVWNPSNRTHDLLVRNVTESDLGLYYCAIHDKKITGGKGIILNENIYHYGNRTTRLSLFGPCPDLPQTPPTPPVSDCSVCWKLLVSVCPVCVLLSSCLTLTCAYYCGKTKVSDCGADQQRSVKVEGREVCYASLDIPSRGQKRTTKKRVENICTYSEVKTERI
ncbi:uncharacterized protein LOC118817103 [Colossoma macropomum]|uniref:uncharacterized protein LOC118817103 n=1 Tax=Colossoma macropomum TaxID=42526 RepID=UPI001863F67B|nr:uncharacterized protein LOC118817103 [Colossoma macropomum]